MNVWYYLYIDISIHIKRGHKHGKHERKRRHDDRCSTTKD